MYRKALTLVTALLVISSSLPANAGTVTIPGSTPVIVRLIEKVSSATHKRGDKVNFEVASDVLVDGKVVIAKGAHAEGEIENASKRFIAGIGGNLDLSVQRAIAVNGATVPLTFKKGAHDGSSLTSVILTVVCCLCFVFIPGKDVTIEKDTLFNATTVGPMDVNLAKPASAVK